MPKANVKVSKHSVLPPIIPERETKFLENIQKFIVSEIEKVGCTEAGPAEECYVIYRNVFEMIIEHVKAYKNILTTIKQEYDAFVEALKKGQRTAFCLRGRLKVLACEPTTLMYYKKRITELEETIKRTQRNSERIENLIQKIRIFRTPPATEAPPPCRKFDPSKALPGLNHKDSFNMDALAKHLAHLEKRMLELKDDMLTKYLPVENMAVIEEQLHHALNRRDTLEAENGELRHCYYRKLQFVNAVNSWEYTDKSLESLKQMIVQIRVHQQAAVHGSITSSSSGLFEHDPTQAKEAADMIEYVERFNELFARGKYDSAAIFAANCPRGILRNEETLEKLKAVGSVKGKMLPLLMYCEALVSTSMALKHPLPANLTTEAIKCALAEKQLGLVMYWITQQKLSLNEEADDYIYLVKNCPNVKLIRCLTQEYNGKPPALSLGATVLFLSRMERKLYCTRVLEEIAKEGRDVLEQMMINDSRCTVEEWKEIAEICYRSRKIKLGKLLISILTVQDGVVELPPDDDGAKLMEHVFL